jgi:hypothetical protein
VSLSSWETGRLYSPSCRQGYFSETRRPLRPVRWGCQEEGCLSLTHRRIRLTGSVLFEGAPPPDSLASPSPPAYEIVVGDSRACCELCKMNCSVSSAREATRVGCLVSLIQWLLRLVLGLLGAILGLLGAILKLLGAILVAPARFIWRSLVRRR